MPQIEVSFDIDADGILHVSAKDKATGKEQRIVIQSSGGLSDKDIEKMVRDAEENQAKDKERKEAVEARNELDSLVHKVTGSLEEHKEKLDDATKESIQAALDSAKKLAENQEVPLEQMQEQIKALSDASMKIGQAMYGKAGDAAKEEEEKEKAAEAEYEEKKDEKKK